MRQQRVMQPYYCPSRKRKKKNKGIRDKSCAFQQNGKIGQSAPLSLTLNEFYSHILVDAVFLMCSERYCETQLDLRDI